ncbi:hypothetical protein TEA_022533 [Camellia sinensis var. sinensis]|uniref:Uncharacterized protein n=1 Tax=Camellia sinensis var. sinensis TaxID=542762 RepID=A0A4S4DUY7_CAMSN|nr:hypothetical protein TEA_022533 [Camellia sinensis var. sinensis]
MKRYLRILVRWYHKAMQLAPLTREVQHRNVVRFVGACTKAPHLCIVTGTQPSTRSPFLLSSFIIGYQLVHWYEGMSQFKLKVSKGLEGCQKGLGIKLVELGKVAEAALGGGELSLCFSDSSGF